MIVSYFNRFFTKKIHTLTHVTQLLNKSIPLVNFSFSETSTDVGDKTYDDDFERNTSATEEVSGISDIDDLLHTSEIGTEKVSSCSAESR